MPEAKIFTKKINFTLIKITLKLKLNKINNKNNDYKPKQNKLLCSAGKKEVIDYHCLSDIITIK